MSNAKAVFDAIRDDIQEVPSAPRRLSPTHESSAWDIYAAAVYHEPQYDKPELYAQAAERAAKSADALMIERDKRFARS